jgi:hypothetical protein
MPLTMRPTGLGSGIDQERVDVVVFCGEWNIGRIYEVRGGPRASAIALGGALQTFGPGHSVRPWDCCPTPGKYHGARLAT